MVIQFWKKRQEKRREEIALETAKSSKNPVLRQSLKNALRDYDSIQDAISLGTKGESSLELLMAAGDIYSKDRRFNKRMGISQQDWYAELKRCHPNIPALQTIKRYEYLSDHRGKVRDGMDAGKVTNITTAEQYIIRRTGTTRKRA